MPEHVLTLKDTDPPELYTLRWDDKDLLLMNPQQERVLALSPVQGCYHVDFGDFFDKQIGVQVDDEKKLLFKKNTAAWKDLHDLIEKQLRTDENFRHHVRPIVRRSWWISLGMLALGIGGAAGLVLLLMNVEEPKKGFWRFAVRYGTKGAFLVCFGLVYAGLTLIPNAVRASRLYARATREQEWYQP